jgi:zona occludens toxin
LITLITGLPGHGKSLRLVELLASKEYEGRPRFAAGIDGLDLDALKVEEFDPKEWQQLPEGAVAFVDECYKDYPARSSHQRPPDYIEKFAEHRHQGLDFVLACQDPMQIDPFLRKLVDRHLHMKRNMGLGFTNIREFQGVNNAPGSDMAKKSAVTITRWKFPTKLFGLYKSASAHTVKRRIPLKAYAAGFVILLAVAAIVNVIAWGSSFMEETENPGGTSQAATDSFTPTSMFGKHDYELVTALPGTPEWDRQVDSVRSAYYARHIEAVEGLPWTKPQYLDVLEPVSFPKPRCILVPSEERCTCHSQQATRMSVPYEACSWIAQNGWFDPTREDNELYVSQETNNQVPRSFLQADRQSDPGQAISRNLGRAPWTNWNDQRRTP